jgi:hypothetical protein
MTNAIGGLSFGSGTHTPLWIFTDISLGNVISIAVDAENNHNFIVADELTYELPGFEKVGVWVLEDLTVPGGIVWYEKSTGILLNGTFFFGGGSFNYTFDIFDTNVDFNVDSGSRGEISGYNIVFFVAVIGVFSLIITLRKKKKYS